MFRNLLKVGAAALIIAVTAVAALAVNNDQTRTFPDRIGQTQQTNYYRITVNFNDPRISTPQQFGSIPQNSFISNVACYVATTFNATSTNVLLLGTEKTSSNEIIAAGGSGRTINLGSAGYQQITAAASLGIGPTSAADTGLFVAYQQTGLAGTSASQGQVICVLEYQPNNDQ